MKILNEEEFEEKVKAASGKVLVDFFATWCGPCRMLAPILEQVAEEVKDCEVYKVDVDEAPKVARSHGIMSVPTLILFENGEETKRVSGVRPKSQIIDFIG